MRSGSYTFWLIVGWLFVCCLSHRLPAQSPATTTLIGRVTDAKTGQPLPFAAVFINATTRGTTTDVEGHYRLTNVLLGTVELVTSYLGYETKKQTLRLETLQPHTVNIALTSNGLTLADVTIKATKDKTWERQFRVFERELLGDTPFARQCTIQNGHVVSFDEKDKRLTASASEPLLVENKALGYRITYNMQFFTVKNNRMDYAGTSRFEELTPANEREKRRWERNRLEAYQGSQRHLLASLVAGTLEQEGFMVYRINRKFDISTYYKDLNRRLLSITDHPVIQPGRLAFERQLILREPLCVIYTKIGARDTPYKEMPYVYSEIEIPVGGYSFIEITTDGRVTKPNGMLTSGYQSRDRLSTLLPQDWTLTKLTEPISTLQLTEGTLLAPDRRLDSLNRQWVLNHRYLSPAVFVQTDKSFYATGDWVWLSGFVLDAVAHKLLTGDDALNLDLLLPNGKKIWHRWIPISNGRFSDNFRLSDTLTTGNYRLRAYSDADRFTKQPAFERIIAVYNFIRSEEEEAGKEESADKKAMATNKPVIRQTDQQSLQASAGPDVQFLPEGGRWVAGLSSRLAIKAVGTDGRGISVSGRIVDAQGQEISQFTTNRLGIGRLTITPKNNQTYQAELHVLGKLQTISLPVVEPEGLVLTVDAVSDSSVVMVRVLGSSEFSKQVVYVLAQSRGQLYYHQKVQLQDGNARLTLPATLFPAGVVHLTLVDAFGQPRAERLVFISEQSQAVRVKILPDKSRYTPRERIALTVQLADSSAQRPLGFLSMAVTDANQLPDDTTNADIRTHLLLTGELRGVIEQPSTYSSTQTRVARQTVDNLLVTQGWRRLTWQKPTTLEAADTLAGIGLAGRVVDEKNKPLSYAELLLTGFGKAGTITRSVGADVDGRFRLGGLFVTDTVRIMAQIMDNRLKPIKGQLVAEIPGEWFARLPTTSPPDWGLFQKYILAARQRQQADSAMYRDPRVRQLKEVVVKASIVDDRPDYIKRFSLHGKPDNTILFDHKSPRYSTLYEMLIGRVPGVTVTRNTPPRTGYNVNIRGANSFMSSTQPFYLMDGIPIEDPEGDRLLTFNPADIERIEVLKGPSAAMYGSRGGNGVIAFYTYRGKPNTTDTAPAAKGLGQFTLIGFLSVQREFYVPRYESAPEPNAPIDQRDVLYWKPIMQTDSQGKSVAAFPLTDVVRTIRVVLQGVTADGRPISAVQILKVQ